MNNEEKNDWQLGLASLSEMALGIAIAQKKYFDTLIDNGFTEEQALYLTYHYNPFTFNEGFNDYDLPDDN